MDLKTAKSLNRINYEFYQTIGKFFDASRNYFWPGWEVIMPYIQRNINARDTADSLKVLDLGCGNARFAEFLVSTGFADSFEYCGLEYSKYLIEKAEIRLGKLKVVKSQLVETDILFESWGNKLASGNFDLAVMFGVMHHIPSYELRVSLLRQIWELLSRDALFVVTFWKFADIERLRKRIVSKDSSKFAKLMEKYSINPQQLEASDYILVWERGGVAYRYCHYFTTDEARNLLEDAGFKVIDLFLGDAKENSANEYYICSK